MLKRGIIMARRHDYYGLHYGITGGVVLVVLGVAFLIDQFWDIDIWKFWPVILIVVGIIAIRDNLGQRKQ